MTSEQQAELDAFLTEHADFHSKHIQGYIRTDHPAGNNGMGGVPIETSLVTQIDGNLWMGGTPAPRPLPGYFQYVLNLYPWEPYPHDHVIEMRAVKLYDGTEVPPYEKLLDLATWAAGKAKLGPTLVHCQAGLNRSGLIVAMILMMTKEITSTEAIAILRQKRDRTVLCNMHFERFLLSLDHG